MRLGYARVVKVDGAGAFQFGGKGAIGFQFQLATAGPVASGQVIGVAAVAGRNRRGHKFGLAATHGRGVTGGTAVLKIKAIVRARPGKDVVGKAITVAVGISDQTTIAQQQTGGNGRGVRGRVQHVLAVAGGNGGHIVGRALGQGIGVQLVVIGGDVFHRQGDNVGAVLGVRKGDIHLVGVGLELIGAEVGHLDTHVAVKRVPVIVQFGCALVAAVGILGGRGLGHAIILIGQIGERVDLGKVGAEGIAELIGAVAAVGVGAVGVDGTAGVDVAVVIAGSGGVAEVKQIILGILYAGKAVTAVFVHREISRRSQLVVRIGGGRAGRILLAAIGLQRVQDAADQRQGAPLVLLFQAAHAARCTGYGYRVQPA